MNHLANTILLIEDDPVTCDLVKLVIKRLNYQVITARDGQEALDLLKTTPVQLILMDILLPFINGLDLLKRIRDENLQAGAPVIILSALGYREIVEQALQNGASDFIVKPFKVDLLVNRIQVALEKELSAGSAGT